MEQQQQQTLARLPFQRKNLRLNKEVACQTSHTAKQGQCGSFEQANLASGFLLCCCGSWSHPPIPHSPNLPHQGPPLFPGHYQLHWAPGKKCSPIVLYTIDCGLEQKCAPHWILLQTRGNSSRSLSELSIHSEPASSQAASHFILVLGTIVPILQIRNLRLRVGMGHTPGPSAGQ